MRNTNQPQNTKQNLVRDASVQISEDERLEEEYAKARALWAGSIKEDEAENPGLGRDALIYGTGYGLAILIQDLTSSNKYERDRAKKRVRDLVKLGKEGTK